MKLRRSMTHAGLALASLALSACNGGTEPEPGPETLAVVSGGGQSAEAGETLTSPLVVRVTQDGAPVVGKAITWSVTAGGGSVNPTSSTTDASGTASTTWTLGAVEGANAVQASAAGVSGSPVTFNATGTAPPTPPPSLASVSVEDNFFDPATQRLAVGGTVTWTWNGSVGHNVTFSAGPNSATQTTGTFNRTFSTAGSFPYQCTIHGGMTGTITVE